AIAIDDRITDYVDGVNRLDERVLELMRPVAPLPVAPAQESLATDALALLGPPHVRSRCQGVNLFGPRGAGRVAVAQALAARMGLRLYRVDAARLPAAGADRIDMLRLLAREAILAQIALYVEHDD